VGGKKQQAKVISGGLSNTGQLGQREFNKAEMESLQVGGDPKELMRETKDSPDHRSMGTDCPYIDTSRRKRLVEAGGRLDVSRKKEHEKKGAPAGTR